MRNWRRALAVLLALAMSLSMAAISEEQVIPEGIEEPAPVEELVEAQPAEELTAEEAPVEEVPEEAEPAEEVPEEEAPAEEVPEEEPAEEPTEEPAEAPEAEEPAEAEPAEEPVEEPEAEIPENADLNASSMCPDGEHDFWDYENDEPSDTCADCGYKCPHPAKSRHKENSPEYKAVTKFDGQNHIVEFDLYEVVTCEECYMTLSSKLLKQNLKSKEPHEFYDDYDDETDVCALCGYDRSGCQHTNRLYYIDISEEHEFEGKPKIDKTYHTVSGYMYLSEWCADCGKYFKDLEYGHYTDVKEAHWYAKGKCILCGYKGNCKHPNMQFYTGEGEAYPYYVNYGNATYHYLHVDSAWAYCETCGYEKSVKDYNVKEEHVCSPENPDVCMLCGYKVQPTGVTIDTPASTTLTLGGDPLALSAKVSPVGIESAILWTSSNRAVATVSGQGIVTAVGAGTTKITAKSENGKASKPLSITVVDPRVPTKLQFSSKSIEKKMDETVQLKELLAVEPATAELLWTSSDYTIVDVDDETGEAIMQSTGTATITVSGATDSGKKAKKASIKIAVKDPTAPSKITLEPSKKITMNTSDAPVTIKATLNPEAQGVWGIIWASSNENVAIVDDETGTVTAVGKGKAKITATAAINDNKGKPVRASVTVQVKNDSFIPESMTLSAETLNLTTDSELAEVVATLTPGEEKYGSFTWTNSNKAAVNLDVDLDGKTAWIEPLAEGTAKITVAAKKNKKVKKVLTVNVTDTHKITKFSLKQSGTQTLFVGDDLQLEPVFGGTGEESAVSYSAKKNKGIVDLDAESGLITGLKPGTVQITAKTAKKIGSGKKAKAGSAKVTIQVVDPKAPKEIVIDQSGSVSTIALGEPVQLSCTITAEDGTTSKGGVKWTVSDGKKAVIDDEGKLYAIKAGVSITVTATTDANAANGKPKKATITLKS